MSENLTYVKGDFLYITDIAKLLAAEINSFSLTRDCVTVTFFSRSSIIKVHLPVYITDSAKTIARKKIIEQARELGSFPIHIEINQTVDITEINLRLTREHELGVFFVKHSI